MSDRMREPAETLGDGFQASGKRPGFPEITRWVSVANVPDGPLPSTPTLVAKRATQVSDKPVYQLLGGAFHDRVRMYWRASILR